jgi:hypothetical protein
VPAHTASGACRMEHTAASTPSWYNCSSKVEFQSVSVLLQYNLIGVSLGFNRVR